MVVVVLYPIFGQCFHVKPILTQKSFAARLSGNKVGAVEELDAASSKQDGFLSFYLKKIKRWLLSHSQHLNFFTILVLASVSVNFSLVALVLLMNVHLTDSHEFSFF